MLRECNQDDITQIYEIGREEIVDVEIDRIRNIHEEARKFIVWDEDRIKGFAYLIEFNKEQREWDMGIYVQPKERRKGIGIALYRELQKYLEYEIPNVIITEFRTDIMDYGPFYEMIGYKKWFGSPELHYRGKFQPETDLEFISYEDKYYQQYTKCRQECFYEMSVKNDFKPYVIPLSEEDKKSLFCIKDSIYVILDNKNFVGAITINDGYLDHIMVSPSYQGKGYGKKITQFGINKELSKGTSIIRLCYIEGNEKAENLYKSLGFEMVQNTHVYRKFADKWK